MSAAVMLTVVTLALGAEEADKPQPARFGDFAAYWTAGRIFCERGNNYDPEVVRQVERREDLTQTFVIWNPPWTFPLLAPFALLPFTVAALAWCLLSVVMVVLSANLVGRQLGMTELWSTVLGITFLPAAICIGISQLANLVLAGAVLYWYGLHRQRPWFAGAALALCAIKPHIVGLLWLAVLFVGRPADRWRVVGGLLATLTVLTALTAAWNPQLPVHYLAALRHPPESPPTQYYAATLGMWLRMESGLGRYTWVQFLPFLCAVGAFGWYLWKRTGSGSAEDALGLALLTSSIALPYGWHYDQATLLPIYLWLWTAVTGQCEPAISRWRRATITLGLLAFELGQIAMLWAKVQERWYVVWPLLLAILLGIRLGGLNTQARD